MKPKAPKGWMYVTVLIPHSTRGPDFIDGRGMRIIDTVKALAFRDQAESLVRQLRAERAVVRCIQAAYRECLPDVQRVITAERRRARKDATR